jgi:UDP-N-acetylmuramoylalanine--D-glutamate ligase
MEPFVLVVGLGKTGVSIARYLQRKGINFLVFDTREAPSILDDFRSEFPNILVCLGRSETIDLSQITRVICSPGVSQDIALLTAVRAQGLLIESDIDCFAAEISAPVVAITGTNGKSTVTQLLGEAAIASGRRVGIAGNIGAPVLDCLQAPEPSEAIDLWVLELSSFQLDITHALKPLAATFLNLSDDHLDRHHNSAAYAAAKQRVYRGAEVLLFNRDDTHTYPEQAYLQENVHLVSYGQNTPQAATEWGLALDANGARWLAKGEQFIMPVEAVGIQGIHNALNALAVLALADAIGLPIESTIHVLKTFKGLPHRCQDVRLLEGVRWINDSKGTNVGATVSALQGLGPLIKGQLILIAGGQGKGAEFEALRAALKAHVRLLILIGEDAALLEHALGDLVEVIHADSMENAVIHAKNQAKPGDAVLLSPACASFDWFDDFNHRGEVFTRLVEVL